MPREVVVELEAICHTVLDMAVQTSTAIDYDRNWENFNKFCRSCRIQPTPFTYRSTAMFLVWLVKVLQKCTMNDAVMAAIHHKRAILGIENFSDIDLNRLTRLKRGLRKLAPHIANKAAPLTASVLHQVCGQVERSSELLNKLQSKLRKLRHARTSEGAREATRLAFAQWKARAFISHSAMLRAGDHSIRERRAYNCMTKACVQWRSDILILWVPPGKANADFEPTFHHLDSDGDLDGAAKLFLNYWILFDFDSRAENENLWPRVLNEVIMWGQIAKVAAFVQLTKFLLQITQFPDTYISQVTGHSFRSGGCTDYLAAGAPDNFVRLQGRWRSDCYQIYRRHSLSYGRNSVQRVFASLRLSWQEAKYKQYCPLVSQITDEDGI
jgi:hypothetical protein